MVKGARSLYLGDVVDEVLVAVLRVNLAQLCQPLQVTLDLLLLPLKRQAVVHHRFDLLHLLWSLSVSDGPPLHGSLVLCFLLPRKPDAGFTGISMQMADRISAQLIDKIQIPSLIRSENMRVDRCVDLPVLGSPLSPGSL